MTRAQLLHEWRLRSFPEPVNDGCSVVQTGGVDLDEYISARMDDWYHALLAEAPMDMLAPVEMAGSVEAVLVDGGSALVMLPDHVVRVTELRIEGLGQVALASGGAARSVVGQRRFSPRRSPGRAVAVVDGHELFIYPPVPFTSAPRIESLMAVTDIAGEYRLDRRALGTITIDKL